MSQPSFPDSSSRKIWSDHDNVLQEALTAFTEEFESENPDESELELRTVELFNAYDLDLSGGMDEEEFRDLLALLYPDLSIRAVAECMKAVRPIFGTAAGALRVHYLLICASVTQFVSLSPSLRWLHCGRIVCISAWLLCGECCALAWRD